VNVDDLPPQLRPVLHALSAVMRRREPAIRQRVEDLRTQNPGLSPDDLAQLLIRSTRRRLAATGAAAGATAIAPGVGTVFVLGTAAGQGLYALEQQTELVLAIAMVYGIELPGPDERLMEALVVIGLAGGAVRLRDGLLVAGGQRITVAAFRRLPETWVARAGNRVLVRVLGAALAQRAVASVARAIPLAVGAVAGAGFDWAAATVLGRAAMRYYRRAAMTQAVPVREALAPGGPPALGLDETGHQSL
jgi:hypothetical protein